MKTKRIKIQLPQISDRIEAEAAVGEIALCVSNRVRITAKMDAEIVAVRQKYEANLSAIVDDVTAKTEALRAWAEAHPDEFAKGRKSIEFVQGVIGFRTGTPALALLNRKWTWEKVITAMHSVLPHFLRSKPEVDKESLLAQRDEPVVAAALEHVGLKVTQAESFYVDPKLTDVEVRQTVEEAA